MQPSFVVLISAAAAAVIVVYYVTRARGEAAAVEAEARVAEPEAA